MRAWPAWTLCGILAALLVGTLHAFTEYLLDLRTVSAIPARTEFTDGFGEDGYTGA